MIYMYFDIRFQMVVIFSIYLEQIWFLIYLFQRYKKGRNPLIPPGLRPFLRKLEMRLELDDPFITSEVLYRLSYSSLWLVRRTLIIISLFSMNFNCFF